jgi:methionyl-tRNA synthetase
VCSVALNLYRQIVLYMSPVLPRLAEQSAVLFGAPFDHWSVAQTPLIGTKVQPFKHLMTRVDPKQVAAMVEASMEKAPAGDGKPTPEKPVAAAASPAPEPIAPTVSFEDFSKVDLRVARILAASPVEGSRKLIQLRVSLGTLERTIFAGIRGSYEPAALVGRLIVIVANLAPRQMKVGLSEGMALAAGTETTVFLLSPDSGAEPGQRVH